jgi:hypothetical protein
MSDRPVLDLAAARQRPDAAAAPGGVGATRGFLVDVCRLSKLARTLCKPVFLALLEPFPLLRPRIDGKSDFSKGARHEQQQI